MRHHTIKVSFEGRTAYVDLGDGAQFSKELAEGQTADEFMGEVAAAVQNAFGDNLKSMTISKTGA